MTDDLSVEANGSFDAKTVPSVYLDVQMRRDLCSVARVIADQSASQTKASLITGIRLRLGAIRR
jgi:hypothetical protein